MSKTETLYGMVVSGDPEAVEYYLNLKHRIADGRKAEVIFGAIRSVHERRKAMQGRLHARSGNPHIGADFPPGSYLTPNGKVLTPSAISQLVSLFREAAAGGQMTMMSFASPEVVVVPSGLSRATAKFTPTGTSRSSVTASVLSEANNQGFAALSSRIAAINAAKAAARHVNTPAQQAALRKGSFGT